MVRFNQEITSYAIIRYAFLVAFIMICLYVSYLTVYFTTTLNPHRERLMEVLSKLAEDEDADVGYYSRLAPIGETTIPDDVSTLSSYSLP